MSAARRIRVAFVAGNFVAGGAERHLLELWSRLDRARFEVEIFCFRREGQFADAVAALGWPVRELGVGRRLYGPAGLRGLFRLWAGLRRFRPQVAHCYLFGPILWGGLAGRAAGVPQVVAAKRNVDRFEHPRQRWLHGFGLRLAHHVTAVSEVVADSVVALGVPRGRITVIPNGVDLSRFSAPSGPAPEELGGMGPGATVVGSVGCLAARKDYPVLLHALAAVRARHPGLVAVLVGDGPERASLMALARRLGLNGSVHFVGERPDVERWLPHFDVFALSSREEGMANAVLEAMAAARPVVATAVGGTPEMVESGRTGVLVPPGDAGAFAAALEQVVADPARARRLGEAAAAAVRERFGVAAMVRRHQELYESLASAGSR